MFWYAIKFMVCSFIPYNLCSNWSAIHPILSLSFFSFQCLSSGIAQNVTLGEITSMEKRNWSTMKDNLYVFMFFFCLFFSPFSYDRPHSASHVKREDCSFKAFIVPMTNSLAQDISPTAAYQIPSSHWGERRKKKKERTPFTPGQLREKKERRKKRRRKRSRMGEKKRKEKFTWQPDCPWSQ